MQLSEDQSRALNKINQFIQSDKQALVLSGAAGCGKSTIIGKFVNETKRPIKLSATTHKAVHVAESFAKNVEASTVHSLFGLAPVKTYNQHKRQLEEKYNPKYDENDIVVVDEASMVDEYMLNVLLRHAADANLKLLFVGDSYQLPPVVEESSVEHPPVFQLLNGVHLTQVHRQAEGSPIVSLATRIRQAIDGAGFPIIRESDAIKSYSYNAPTDRKILNGRIAHLLKQNPHDANYVKLLAWRNVEVARLNAAARRAVLGGDALKYDFLPGEQLVANAAIIFHGIEVPIVKTDEIVTVISARKSKRGKSITGYDLSIDTESGAIDVFVADEQRQVKSLLMSLENKAKAGFEAHRRNPRAVSIDNVRALWERYYRAEETFADLRAPYASTIHKSQGSTYEHAVIFQNDIRGAARRVSDKFYARLMYVAATRARSSLTLAV